eukprot:PhM_4_TR240/c0_g1_i2/m.104832
MSHYPSFLRIAPHAGPNPFLADAAQRSDTTINGWDVLSGFASFSRCSFRSMNVHYIGFLDPTPFDCIEMLKLPFQAVVMDNAEAKEKFLSRRRAVVYTGAHPWQFRDVYVEKLKRENRFSSDSAPAVQAAYMPKTNHNTSALNDESVSLVAKLHKDEQHPSGKSSHGLTK